MTTTLASRLAGTWVRDADMHPETNIYGRHWWAVGNREGVYYGPHTMPEDISLANLWWHFPNGNQR